MPVEERVQRLGSVVRPEQILALTGDAGRGRAAFFETAGVACKNCHRIGQDGKEVGPELTAIGKKLDRTQLLESILEPSKRIDPKYVTFLAVFVYFLAGILIPFVVLIVVSMIPYFDYETFMSFPTNAVLTNYYTVMKHPSFVTGLYNSLVLSVSIAVITVLAGIVMAFTIYRTRAAGTKYSTARARTAAVGPSRPELGARFILPLHVNPPIRRPGLPV